MSFQTQIYITLFGWGSLSILEEKHTHIDSHFIKNMYGKQRDASHHHIQYNAMNNSEINIEICNNFVSRASNGSIRFYMHRSSMYYRLYGYQVRTNKITIYTRIFFQPIMKYMMEEHPTVIKQDAESQYIRWKMWKLTERAERILRKSFI